MLQRPRSRTRAFLLLGAIVAFSFGTSGQQIVLYQETFPSSGGATPVSAVGWANDITSNPNRIFVENDGVVFAFQSGAEVPITTAFYTSTSLDTGASGVPFVPIQPEAYTNLTLWIDIRAGFDPDNVQARFAVQVNEAAWFVSTAALPVPQVSGSMASYSNLFSRAASRWNALTVSGDGSAPSASIGAAALSDLVGDITGAGLVFTHIVDAGTHDFDNFRIRATPTDAPPEPPTIVTQPQSRNVYVGETVQFTVGAAGTAPLSYAWHYQGAPLTDSERLSGATSNVLTILDVSAADQGDYSVVITNIAGMASSDAAQLVVVEVPPDLLYEETFPYAGPSGNLSISTVGWRNDVPSNLERVFLESGADNGAVFAFQGNDDVPVTTAFYTSTAIDNGVKGLPFPTINPALYPGVSLNVDIRPGFDPDNIEARFAVQMNGTDWYAAATTLPVNTSLNQLSTYSAVFNPLAAGWDTLTLNGTSAAIGAAAAGDLAGNITGAGVVFTHTVDNGTFDFDNFRITTNAAPEPPIIIAHPASQSAEAGGTVQFIVRATGTPPLSYLWLFEGFEVLDGGNISGATSNVLTIANISAADQGAYSVTINNDFGTATSDPAILTVNELPPNLGAVTITSVANGVITLAWSGAPNVLLQSSTELGPSAAWQEVPNTVGQNTAAVPMTSPQQFFRLARLSP